MEFITEFLPQIWPLFLFIIASIVLLVVMMVLLRQQRQKQRQQAKDRAMGIEPSSKKQSRTPVIEEDYDDYDDGDDPLALLSAARQQARANMPDEDISDLLANMGESPLHRVALEPIAVKLSTGNTTQARELLSVMRDESDGRLMIQIGETAFRSLTTDANAKAEFTRVMKELSGIILKPDDNQPISDEAKPVITPTPTAQAVPAKPAPPKPAPIVEPVIEPVDEAFDKEVAKTIDAAKQLELTERLPGDLPDMRLSENPDNYKKDRFGRVSVKRVDKAPEINIADAIEAYLQYKIEQLPEFQRRGIHIRSAISGGLRIEVDGKKYDFVDEVEDPAVLKLLQETIAEWQERH